MVPLYEIFIGQSLRFQIRVLGWVLPDNHDIYGQYNSSCENVFLSNLVYSLNSYNVCQGIPDNLSIDYSLLVKHSIPKVFIPFQENKLPLYESIFYRSNECSVLTKTSVCIGCSQKQKKLLQRNNKSIKRKANSLTIPLKPKAPISLTSPERIKVTIQSYRIENKMLKSEIQNLQHEISKSSMRIDDGLSADLIKIMSNAEKSEVSPFMKFFWEEQQKYINVSCKTSIRYHPMIIRYCLALQAKSAAAYNEMRFDEKTGTGFVVLPSQRRLRDYKNYIHPKQGFNHEIINELKNKIKDFSDIERFMVILFDEMKIQENLVWSKHTGDLIGFVDLGDVNLNYATLQETNTIASHVLAFLLRSVVNPFKFSLANFATRNATASQIFPLFWKAVAICETQCAIKVVAATCDGASANRKFFRMHFGLTHADELNADTDVVYRTINFFSEDKRYIYFISDAPHLLKTARNSVNNSGCGKGTRFMWNGGLFLIWNHINDIFLEDQECGLQLLPKITYEHVYLTPYSVMNVRLAAQVLSTTVSKVLSNYGPADAAGTAEFCLMFDKFFDIMNVSSTTASSHELKPFNAPFLSTDDPRFSWLKNQFLKYFEDWLKSIEERPGSYTKSEKQKMFISSQTYEGLKITVHSVIELVTFLIMH